MRLEVERAVQSAGVKYPCKLEWETSIWLEDTDILVGVAGPLRFDGVYYSDGERIHVVGDVQANGVGICDRCLDNTNWSREIPVHEVFMTMETDDAWWYEGHLVDMTQPLREVMVVALLDRIVCSDECQGLCIHCGANLNHDECTCQAAQIDPRWAAMAAWKEKL